MLALKNDTTMSSKNDILSAIRRHTGKRYDMPELTLDAITYEDKISSLPTL